MIIGSRYVCCSVKNNHLCAETCYQVAVISDCIERYAETSVRLSSSTAICTSGYDAEYFIKVYGDIQVFFKNRCVARFNVMNEPVMIFSRQKLLFSLIKEVFFRCFSIQVNPMSFKYFMKMVRDSFPYTQTPFPLFWILCHKSVSYSGIDFSNRAVPYCDMLQNRRLFIHNDARST